MRNLTIILVFGVLQLVLVEKAHAYIDLSIGSMLIQGLIAALVSIGFFWRRILSFLSRVFGRKKRPIEGFCSHDCKYRIIQGSFRSGF